ncbi:hypothetical protein KKE92_03435 [Candidatus Micrarchaeota archaeon]|nr:hypothetical protein [Candidatus Micrarchaeota archaeon]MBU1681209.1 hypothetical protein [Candidatus Micrarchaeota archaeon]
MTQQPVQRLYHEVNRLRKKEGLEPISLLHLAHKVSRFHTDQNQRVAKALDNLGMAVLPIKK